MASMYNWHTLIRLGPLYLKVQQGDVLAFFLCLFVFNSLLDIKLT